MPEGVKKRKRDVRIEMLRRLEQAARIKAVATGSVRDNLKLSMLYEFPIKVPAKAVQREIIEKLDRVKRLISLRERELQSLDELIKARFVEMFGNESNPYKWPVINVEEVAKVSVGGRIGLFINLLPIFFFEQPFFF